MDEEFENYTYEEAIYAEEVKSENIWDIELEGSQKIAEPSEKCGEIMLDYDRQFILVCSLCGNQFKSLQLFGGHISSAHTIPEPNANHPFEFLSVSESFMEVKEDNALKLHDKSMHNINSGRRNADSTSHGQENNKYTNNTDLRLNGLQSEEYSSVSRENATNPSDIEVKEEIFECSLCSQAFNDNARYQVHSQVHYKGNNNQKKKLQQGIEETVIRSMFPCTKCDNIYRQKKSLMAHMESVHKNGENCILSKETVCRFCKEEFVSREILEKHIEEEHTLGKIFSCRFCDKSFATSSAHNGHMSTHTGARPHKCPHCPKQFSTSANMRVHIYTHLNIKKHSCKFCGKSFVQSTVRNNHERIHMGEKPFQCEYCGLQFLLHAKLSSHLKRHLNIRDFKCDVCHKTFYSREYLNIHMAVHSVNRPFKCDQCERSFPNQKYLKQHRQIHAGIKKYVCNMCGKAFAQCAGLSTHRKSHRELMKP